jgi:3-oxoacyl-[acyl-carrier protein] reductase
VLGTILATKEAVKHFGPNGGSVINISSIASAGEPTAAIYSGTKGAVDAITRGLAAELGPRKIRDNAIAPGGVETEGTHSAGIVGSDFEKTMIAGTPLGRFGQPDDIARIAVPGLRRFRMAHRRAAHGIGWLPLARRHYLKPILCSASADCAVR